MKTINILKHTKTSAGKRLSTMKTPLAALLILSLTACSSFLEEYSQDTDYVRTWKDLDELLIGDCYMEVVGTNQFSDQANYGMFLHLLADELEENNTAIGSSIHFDDRQRMFGYYTWQQRSGQNESYTDYYAENTTWTEMYRRINVANNVINSSDDVPQSTNAEIEGVAKVRGEAHFIRAFYYFWLTNAYGKAYNAATSSTDPGVPLKTNSEVEDVKFQRNSVEECYQQVLSDLLTAETELSKVTTEKKSIYRADVTAVRLLLSRVYLYMQNWQKAAEYAQKVIDAHPSLQNLNTYTTKWMLEDNIESIFSMGGDDVPTMMGYEYQAKRVSSELYSSYTANDLRKTYWYWSYGPFRGLVKEKEGSNFSSLDKNSSTYYYYAYTEGLDNSQTEVSSLFWLRSAEAYLNLAEAQAYQGNDEQARTTLNTLRAARIHTGAPELEITSSGEQLAQDIREERRRELAFEGHRWFDLRRYAVCSAYPQKTTLTHTYTYYVERGSTVATEAHEFVLEEDDASWTLPIPHEVIEFNTGMVNNGNPWRTYTVVDVKQ